jgi:hypothetical protein
MEAVSFLLPKRKTTCPKSLDELSCVGIARALPLLEPGPARSLADRRDL